MPASERWKAIGIIDSVTRLNPRSARMRPRHASLSPPATSHHLHQHTHLNRVHQDGDRRRLQRGAQGDLWRCTPHRREADGRQRRRCSDTNRSRSASDIRMMSNFVQAHTGANQCSYVCSIAVCRYPAGLCGSVSTRGLSREACLRALRQEAQQGEASSTAGNRQSLPSYLQASEACSRRR